MIDVTGLDENYRRTAYLINPANRPRVMGERVGFSVPWGTVLSAVVWLVYLVSSVYVLVAGGLTIYRFVVLTASNQPTEAVILRRWFDMSGDFPAYYFAVRYAVDDTTYERKLTTDKTTYDNTELGASIEIRYATANPSIAAIELPSILAVIGLLLLIGFAVVILRLLLLALPWPRGRRRPLRRGKLVAAYKIRTWATLSQTQLYLLHVEYRFVSPRTGKIINDEAKQVREDLRLRTLHHGEVIPDAVPLIVLYQNDRRYELL